MQLSIKLPLPLPIIPSAPTPAFTQLFCTLALATLNAVPAIAPDIVLKIVLRSHLLAFAHELLANSHAFARTICNLKAEK